MSRLAQSEVNRRAQRAAAPAGDAPDPDVVGAAARALALLEVFTPELRQLSNAEMADRSGLPRTTVSRAWPARTGARPHGSTGHPVPRARRPERA